LFNLDWFWLQENPALPGFLLSNATATAAMKTGTAIAISSASRLSLMVKDGFLTSLTEKPA
jgi:hypothetical protein